MSHTCVLTVAGSDPTGGAGVECDLRVLQSQGVHGCAVVTALTTQTPNEVRSIIDVPSEDVAARMNAVLGSLTVSAVKIGMVPTATTARLIAYALCAWSQTLPVIVDPIIASTSGHKLSSAEILRELLNSVLPDRVTMTPNTHEARLLLGVDPQWEMTAVDLAQELRSRFQCSVLVTGGDLEGVESTDVLAAVNETTTETYVSPRIPGPSPHGTGCAASSAIAAHLAQGTSLRESVALAKVFVTQAIKSAFSPWVAAPAGRPLLRFPNEPS